MSRIVGSLPLATALLLAWAMPAVAAPSWTAPIQLTGTANALAMAPSVALNANGQGIEAWNETNDVEQVIRVAQHDAGGAWSTFPSDLSSSLPGSACGAFASIDASGNELVAWSQYSGATCGTGNLQMRFAARPAGSSSWSAPGAIGVAAPAGPPRAFSATNGAGQMLVVWSSADPVAHTQTLWGAVGSISGFSTASTLITAPAADSIIFPAAAIGPNGDAAAQWNDFASGSTNVDVSVRPRGQAFQSTPMPLTTVTTPATAETNPGGLAIDAAGNVLSSYLTGTGPVLGVLTPNVVSRLRDATSGVWEPPESVATVPAPLDGVTVMVGFDATGNATAVWHESTDASPPRMEDMRTATRAAGISSTWTGQTRVTDLLSTASDEPSLAVAPSGAALVSWELEGSQKAVQALYRPAGGTFGPLLPVGVGDSAGIAIAPSGDAAITFAGDGTFPNPRVSILDESAPTLTAVAVPPQETVGGASAMAATVTDAWSALAAGQPSWSFGDGTVATGASVTHTYTAAGTYTVTIGASDSGGNAVTTTRQVVVTRLDVLPLPLRARILRLATSASWKRSRLVGHVVVRGSSPLNLPLTLSLRRFGHRTIVLRRKVTPANHAWKATLVLPAGLAPGRFVLIVSGSELVSVQRSIRLIAPKSGIVTGRRGSVSARVVRARFVFGTLPIARATISTQWTRPDGRTLGKTFPKRAAVVASSVESAQGSTLPRGRWRCVVRVGGVVVATLDLRVR